MLCGIILFAGCSKENVQGIDEEQEPDEQEIAGVAPEILGCDFFLEDRVLTKRPGASVDYIIDCGVTSRNGLTIEPGVTLGLRSFLQFSGHNRARLRAVGTADDSITFTAVKKESDGTWVRNSVKGGWEGLILDTRGHELEHVIIEYAGKNQPMRGGGANIIVGQNGAISIKNAIIAHSAGNGLRMTHGGSTATLESVTFKDTDDCAIYAHRNITERDFVYNNLAFEDIGESEKNICR